MSTSLEQLQPAPNAKVGIYLPYYKSNNQRTALPLVISLYDKGSLEGERKIEGGNNIPFVATWSVSTLPADMTRCRLQFDGNADLSYEITMANFEFINYLIELLIIFKRSRVVDFSRRFYTKLLRYDD
ncbi:hypothetical protein IQ235_00385 [Oscillatoriales cyanobacterium LEGE 11467]|uniref:Uncharacterized protein n=1 Tax=Zarconia navalis LEGE 11467 TaxID=1828826 RepID=A0A928VS41_9CYAN|nr:type IV pilus biogenesis protein EbsA [Zarconia navalis]MBE9039252.1 hypothetical protein [Zarconia navalis LEGE 11467]